MGKGESASGTAEAGAGPDTAVEMPLSFLPMRTYLPGLPPLHLHISSDRRLQRVKSGSEGARAS